jgi:hypothetical protein
MIHCSQTGEFGDLLFPSSEKSITRFCCVMLAGGGPLRDSYLDYLVMLVPHWPQNMCLISLIFEFGTQLCSTQSLLRHRASLYQAVPQSRQCKDFSSRPRVREDPPKDQWPWSRTELLLEGLGPETPAITLFIPFL